MSLVAFDGLADVQRRELVSMSGLEPIIQRFGGATATDNLVNGMHAAQEVLKKHTSTLTFDPNQANALFDRIEVWQQQNAEKLRMLMRQGAKTVPEQIALSLGASEARSFIVASFSEACRGLKGWVGGAVAANYKTNPNFTEAMALADRESRLITFASIVLLDRDGTLSRIFSGQGFQGQDALGIEPVTIGLIVVAIVSAAAAIAFIATESIKQSAMNERIDKLCAIDQQQCKSALIETIRADAKRLEEKSPLNEFTSSAAKYLAIGLFVYLGITMGVPAIRSSLERRRASRSA